MTRASEVIAGSTGTGKSLTAARAIAERDEACLTLDPHIRSLAHTALVHAEGNILFERLSDVRRALGFELLRPSQSADPVLREMENQRSAEAFVEILLRKRGAEGLGSTPLLEEWVFGALTLYLCQSTPKPLTQLPFAFLPSSDEFAALVRDCVLPEVRAKFRALERLTPRALRAEVGSASRLINSVFRSPAFQARCRGGFDLGAFLQRKGKLLIERGEEIGDDTMRGVMGAVILLVVEHARRRPEPWPPIRIYIDEATNARLVGAPELRGIAETRKYGLFWTFLVQNLDFPGGAEAVLQNCRVHHWYCCESYELARKAATDVAAGLPRGEESRAERIARLTDDIMNLAPGWRWTRDPAGSRREYVPLLENPWPDWPGLREARLEEKLCRIYARPEYGDPGMPPSTTSSPDSPPPPPRSPGDSSPAQRFGRGPRRPAGGSPGSGGADESA